MSHDLSTERNPAVWMRDCVEEFAGSAENTIDGTTQEQAWARPLVGFSKGTIRSTRKSRTILGRSIGHPGMCSRTHSLPPLPGLRISPS